jgi:hypothetical protein
MPFAAAEDNSGPGNKSLVALLREPGSPNACVEIRSNSAEDNSGGKSPGLS